MMETIGILVMILMGYIGVSGQMGDNGHAVNCKSNPVEAVCEYKLNN